jgi:hypothetical protein
MQKNQLLGIALGALLIGAAGCTDLTVPDLNNPSLEELTQTPTKTSVGTAAQGLMIGTRAGIANRNGYVSLLGIIGRESYNFDIADPRFITEMLIGPLDGASPAFGGNLWGNPYANIRGANIILDAVDLVEDMTSEEQEATKGFTKTIKALDFLKIINVRDDNGAPIAVEAGLDEPPAPIVGKSEVFAFIVQLLDEAQVHLQAGGSAFPFSLSAGFVGFDDPASFLTFNRALKARVDVYMGNFSAALTSLSGSFVDDAGDLSTGVYHEYGTQSGGTTNPLFEATSGRNILAHPSIVTDADLQAGGEPDARLSKIVTVDERTLGGITTDQGFAIYESLSAFLPIIRNEELILLRAEANVGLGDIPAATTDINFIRTTSGGLDPRLDLDAANILDELLKQKRYSLLYEGGHRWIDMRRYGKLGDLPLDVAGHTVHDEFPIPTNETLARQ